MKRSTVRSSLLTSVGYDPASFELEVELKDGKIERFRAVPEHVFAELMRASSHGHFFLEYIAAGNYPRPRGAF